ncbi:MAG: hypothetical protein M3461_08455 [Pseudomonadota bacterium]|nr:hypothetical protein [Pseudomonadota bacterium]
MQKFKSFIDGAVRFVEGRGEPHWKWRVHPRANCRPVCSGCDRLATRRFAFVPLWGRKVFLVYAPRRVIGRGCGIRVKEMPWPFTFAIAR